jgi:DNA polymerase-4
VAAMPLAKIWGIAQKTRERLIARGCSNTAAVLALDAVQLGSILGKNAGQWVYQICRGIDPGIYEGQIESHSISREITFEDDLCDAAFFSEVLYQLAYDIQFRLHREHATSRTLCVKFRSAWFETHSIQRSLNHNLDTMEETWALAQQLFLERWNHREDLRLIGLGFHNVQPIGEEQGELFDDLGRKRNQVEKTIMTINSKYAHQTLTKARLLKND